MNRPTDVKTAKVIRCARISKFSASKYRMFDAAVVKKWGDADVVMIVGNVDGGLSGGC